MPTEYGTSHFGVRNRTHAVEDLDRFAVNPMCLTDDEADYVVERISANVADDGAVTDDTPGEDDGRGA